MPEILVNNNNNNDATASAPPTTSMALAGADISKILNSDGPIVNAVLLKAACSDQEDANPMETIQLDTTPKKQMVQKVLGAPFTFLGQYEDEGIILMIRKDADTNDKLTVNPHSLPPPLHNANVRGDILIVKVAAEKEEEDENNTADNDEFFLNYTKEEYVAFLSSRPANAEEAVVSHDEEEEEEDMEDEEEEEEDDSEMEGEDDSDDEEDDGAGFMELLVGQVIQRFQQENDGRMPDEQEIEAIKSAIAQKMGGAMP